ncbi:MAG: polysaccharide deacetylase family protein [Eubacteriales bacterium]|nr:polysaccharide deacetylase family protein [Eubacteriales bacterium]
MEWSADRYRWLRKHRGMGILFLCLMMLLLGGRRMEQYAVETGSRVGTGEVPIYSVRTRKEQVALTFDVVGDGANIEKILEILKRYHVSATFFVTGNWAQEHPGLLRRIVAQKHDLGNRGVKAEVMTDRKMAESMENISRTGTLVKELTGIEMEFFRAPYGMYDDPLIRAASADGYYTIQWSVDSDDWKDYGADRMVRGMLQSKEMKKGAILRLHSGAKYTLQGLGSLIEGITEEGYEIVPVSALVERESYHMSLGGVQIKNYAK